MQEFHQPIVGHYKWQNDLSEMCFHYVSMFTLVEVVKLGQVVGRKVGR